jgi:tetratricopeptide (TPR) repeat protein
MLARGDSSALNNLAIAYGSRREYVRAETLLVQATRRTPGNQTSLSNLFGNYQARGAFREADSVLALLVTRFPNALSPKQAVIGQMWERGELDRYERAIDSAQKAATDPTATSWAINATIGIEYSHGRLARASGLFAKAAAADSALGRRTPPVFIALQLLTDRVNNHLPWSAEVRALEESLSREPIIKLPVAERPYLWLANVFAGAGRADRARQFLAQYDAEVKDTALKRSQMPGRHGVLSAIAETEKRWRDAIDEARKADSLPDGPAYGCEECLPRSLIFTFAEAGMADSALAQYETYKRTPMGRRPMQGPDMYLGAPGYEKLAQLYEQKGDSAKAAEYYRIFIDLWKTADPELQPRVAEARRRLTKLVRLEKPRDPSV